MWFVGISLVPLRPDRDWFNHCDMLFFSVCDCVSNSEDEEESGNVAIRELDCEGVVDIKDDDSGGDGDANVEFWDIMEDTLEDIACSFCRTLESVSLVLFLLPSTLHAFCNSCSSLLALLKAVNRVGSCFCSDVLCIINDISEVEEDNLLPSRRSISPFDKLSLSDELIGVKSCVNMDASTMLLTNELISSISFVSSITGRLLACSFSSVDDDDISLSCNALFSFNSQFRFKELYIDSISKKTCKHSSNREEDGDPASESSNC